MIANYGAPTSLKNLLAHFRNVERIPITRETLKRHIDLLVQAKTLYRRETFDIKSKRSLRGGEKHYLADLPPRMASTTDARIDYGPALENLACIYARCQRYPVSVGRIGRVECDFIVRNSQMEHAYVQVSQSIGTRETEKREYAPFAQIRDGWPRYPPASDHLLQRRDGVRHANIAAFMSKNRSF